MQDLIPVAEQIAARLVERTDLRGVAGGARRVRVFPGLGRRLYPRRPADIDGYSRSGDEGHPLSVGALCEIAGEPDSKPLCGRLGLVGNRRDRTDRQPLRRRRRPQLHGHRRRVGSARHDVGNGQSRPACQHAHFREHRAELFSAKFITPITVVPANAGTTNERPHRSRNERITWSFSGLIRYDSMVRSPVCTKASTGMPGISLTSPRRATSAGGSETRMV
jgi:hypothetical protein